MDQKSTEKIEIGKLQIDLSSHVVIYEGSMINLSKREYELLIYFAQNHEKIITKTELAEKIWRIYDAWGNQKVIEVYI